MTAASKVEPRDYGMLSPMIFSIKRIFDNNIHYTDRLNVIDG
jgi:hypothetical protein